MADQVIEDINNGTLTAENLSHETLRKNYKRQIYEDGRDVLGRGRGVLDDTDHLDQYLHSYGRMANQQWEGPLDITMIEGETTVIDYGCGQGLSFLNAICRWQLEDDEKTWQDYIKSIVLIEPSQIALNRAEAIAKLKFPDANIYTITKKLEELGNEDLAFDANKIMIHIFSQVLDIPLADGFDLLDFFETITSTVGAHYIHVVSHEVDSINSQRNILKLYKYIVSKYVDAEVSGDTIRAVLKTPPKEPLKIIKKATSMALNTFKIEGTARSYDTIAIFACIKTY